MKKSSSVDTDQQNFILKNLKLFNYTWVGRKIRKQKIYLNAIILSPDRFLTIFSLIFAVLIVFFPNNYHLYLIIFIPLIYISSVLALLLSRYDPPLYARLVTKKISSDIAIRIICDECLRIIEKTSAKRGDELFHAITKIGNQLSIIKEMKIILAKRFEMDVNYFCEYFLKFSPSIYRSRQIKNAFNTMDDLKGDKVMECESIKIIEYTEQSKTHLNKLISSRLDYNRIGYMSKGKSTFIQMLHFSRVLDSIRDLDELKLFFHLQKSIHGGILLSRLIVLTIIGAKQAFTNNEREDWEDKLKFLCLTPKKGKFNFSLTESSAWICKVSSLLSKLYIDISKQVEERINEIRTANSKKDLYILIKGYSRGVRTVLRRVMANKKYKNVQIFILTSQENNGFNYRSRLMRHQLLKEHFVLSKDEEQNDVGFKGRVRIGRFDMLKSKIENNGDDVVFLTGCKGIKINKKNTKKSIIGTLQPDKFEEILRGTFDYLQVIAIAGAHKVTIQDLELLPKTKELINNVEKYLPEIEWTSYYVWKEIEVITNMDYIT